MITRGPGPTCRLTSSFSSPVTVRAHPRHERLRPRCLLRCPARASAAAGRQLASARRVFAVPCLQRAAAVEEYGDREEVEVEAGGSEGWVTAASAPRRRPSHTAPAAAAAAATNEDGFEEVPCVVGGEVGSERSGAEERGREEPDADQDAIPDISNLDLEDEQPDLVRSPPSWTSLLPCPVVSPMHGWPPHQKGAAASAGGAAAGRHGAGARLQQLRRYPSHANLRLAD